MAECDRWQRVFGQPNLCSLVMPDITTTQIFSDGEKGITATKMNNIIANSVIQPDFVTAKPSSSTLDPTDQLLEVKGAGTYARITGSQLISSVSAQVDATPQIYSVRLRSFNAIGNPTFEVDQRSVNGALTYPAGASNQWQADRWFTAKSAATAVVTGLTGISSAGILIPGTNFRISRSYLQYTVTTPQATLAATEALQAIHYVEGPRWRELASDVHSISLLCFCSVALSFAISLRDNPTTYSLVIPCSIPANTPTLLTFPNLPLWPSGGNWSQNPGTVGYIFTICLGVGTTYQAPSTGGWVSGNYIGYSGMSNFMATSGAVFQSRYVQHEPGAVCTTPMDCPFQQNYDDCLRYYQKSYDYDVAIGTPGAVGPVSLMQNSTTGTVAPIRFHKPLAKIPTCTAYNPSSGAANSLRLGGVDYAVSSFISPGKAGFFGVNTATMPAVVAGAYGQIHYIADTGW